MDPRYDSWVACREGQAANSARTLMPRSGTVRASPRPRQRGFSFPGEAMRLPFMQLESDLVAHGAALVGCLPAQALGHIAMLRAWAVSQANDETPPDGLVRGDAAPRLIEAAAQWQGPRGTLFEALLDAGQVQRESEGVRVLHLAPYAKAWERNAKAKARMANSRERSANKVDTGRERSAKFMGQTQTQMEDVEETTASQGPADAVPTPEQEDLPDATEDATPVGPAANGCPDCTALAPCWLHLRDAVPAKSPKPPRQPSKAEAAYGKFQEARQRACEAAGVAYVPDRWHAARINKDLGAVIREGDDAQGKFVAAFEEFLGDESMSAKGWSLTYFITGGVRSKYEQRALRGAA